MTTEILPHPKTVGFIHKEQGVVDGFTSLGANHAGGFFVVFDRIRIGIGSVLFDHVKRLHSELVLTVYKKNVVAIRFYEAQGFQTVGESTYEHIGYEQIRIH